jgi:hypothetical protein
MSLTIYYGLRATTSDPFEVAKEVRSVLEPAFHAKFKEANDKAENNVGVLWSDVFLLAPKTEIPHEYRISHDLYQLVEMMHRKSEYTFSELNFAYDVVLYQNAADGNPLVLVFGDKTREYTELLIESGVVTEYGYWNNTDPEEGVSEEDWAIREKAWSAFAEPELVSTALTISIPDSVETTVKLLPPLVF